MRMIKTDRSLVMYILLSLITCGIYPLYFIYKIADDVNAMCEGDGEKTSGLLKYFLLTIVTCGFYPFYWYYKIGNRIQKNGPRYGVSIQENGTTILLWQIVGALLCGLGPLIAMHILMKITNQLAMAYNVKSTTPVAPVAPEAPVAPVAPEALAGGDNGDDKGGDFGGFGGNGGNGGFGGNGGHSGFGGGDSGSGTKQNGGSDSNNFNQFKNMK